MTDEAAAPAPLDWREDLGWRLIASDPAYWGDKPVPAKPPKNAELAQPDCWCSVYAPGFKEPVATWAR